MNNVPVFRLTVLAVASLLLQACSSATATPTAAPTPTTAPTPDVSATVSAAIRATQTAAPTQEPTATPFISVSALQQLRMSATASADEVRSVQDKADTFFKDWRSVKSQLDAIKSAYCEKKAPATDLRTNETTSTGLKSFVGEIGSKPTNATWDAIWTSSSDSIHKITTPNPKKTGNNFLYVFVVRRETDKTIVYWVDRSCILEFESPK